jgi:hypothetical protein
VLCRKAQSSPNGEHILPVWFRERYVEAGNYVWEISDNLVRTRAGELRIHNTAGSIKLPVCSECNGILNHRFEEPAKAIIEQIMDSGGKVELSREDLEVAGRWFLKTLCFIGHPEAVWSEPASISRQWITNR